MIHGCPDEAKGKLVPFFCAGFPLADFRPNSEIIENFKNSMTVLYASKMMPTDECRRRRPSLEILQLSFSE